jgi:hypothetical protein
VDRSNDTSNLTAGKFTLQRKSIAVIWMISFFVAISPILCLGALHLCYPSDLVFDNSGNLWVVDNNNNRVIEYAPPFTAGQSASLELGQPDFNSKSLGSGAAGLNYPWGIAIDGAGHVWVSDGLNWRVLRFSPPFSNGQAADLVLGYPNFTTIVNNDPQ